MVLVQHLFEFVVHWLIRFSTIDNRAKRSCTVTETDFSLLPSKSCRKTLGGPGQTDRILHDVLELLSSTSLLAVQWPAAQGKTEWEGLVLLQHWFCDRNAELVERLGRTDGRKRAEKICVVVDVAQGSCGSPRARSAEQSLWMEEVRGQWQSWVTSLCAPKGYHGWFRQGIGRTGGSCTLQGLEGRSNVITLSL